MENCTARIIIEPNVAVWGLDAQSHMLWGVWEVARSLRYWAYIRSETNQLSGLRFRV